jgi:hypothetical protein
MKLLDFQMSSTSGLLENKKKEESHPSVEGVQVGKFLSV